MERHIIKTADGSATIFLPEWNEHYHSKHGAIQEALHVFINTGLEYFLKQHPSKGPIRILEMGFGTGLNALLTCLTAEKSGIAIHYSALEAYPIPAEELPQLNYAEVLSTQKAAFYFENIHRAAWEQEVEINSLFSLFKQKKDFYAVTLERNYNIIYFDAFGPRVQPELWSVNMFENMYQCLAKNGILVTYSAKGSVRRAMETAGFFVERLPGPPGKREMLRATKR